MPRAGLTPDHIVAAAAQLCDEIGFHELTMGVLAQRIGVRPPSLYKHVDSLADLQHRIAILAMTELGDQIRDAIQGTTEFEALKGLATATRDYVTAHPGRYAATIGAAFSGTDDPLFVASARVLDSIAAVLRGYGIGADESDHAIRMMRCTLHGFAVLVAANGFQWGTDLNDSFRWMIDFLDTGLRALH